MEKGKVEVITQENTETADFLAGDKVVCVDTNWESDPRTAAPILGQMYCVRNVFTCSHRGQKTLRLVSLIRNLGIDGVELGWYAYHFRRVHR